MAAVADVRTEILPDRANPQLLVHVTDDDGLTGTGETWWGTYQPQAEPGAPVRSIAVFVDDVLAPALLGQPSSDIAACWDTLTRATYQYGPEGIVSTAIAGIDLALWDLAGHRAGRPVADLLGPRVHDRIPAYASLHWLGDADRACADAVRALDAGFAGVKLHEADGAVIAAVRQAVGPEMPLMVDFSARFNETDAMRQALSLEDLDLTWIEEPTFPQQDHAALGRLSLQLKQRLAAGENEFSLSGFTRLVGTGRIGVLQPDLAKCGGLTTAAAVAALAEEANVWLCPHNFSLGPSLGANIHWAMTAAATRWIEVPFLPEEQTFPGTWRLPTLTDGCVGFPDVDGLGWS
jgi:D-galactarolactone cycloisomerase